MMQFHRRSTTLFTAYHKHEADEYHSVNVRDCQGTGRCLVRPSDACTCYTPKKSKLMLACASNDRLKLDEYTSVRSGGHVWQLSFAVIFVMYSGQHRIVRNKST